MIKKKIIVGLVCIIAVLGLSIAVYASQFYPSQGVNKSNYSEIVAKVGDKQITGKQLTGQVQLEKNKWERIGYPQSESFYEKAALRQLILNAQLENIAKQKGINVTEKEVSDYLGNIINKMSSLSDNDPNKIEFINDMRASGFETTQEYSKSPEVKVATKDILTRAKVKKVLLSKVPLPSDEEVNNYIKKNKININNPEEKLQIKYELNKKNRLEEWNNFTNELINTGNYEIFADIDIKELKYPEVEPNQHQSYKANIKQ